jgi:hypothetical protein
MTRTTQRPDADAAPTSTAACATRDTFPLRRVMVWLVAVGVFLGVASTINPLRTPASPEPGTTPPPLISREAYERETTPWHRQAIKDQNLLLGTLEGNESIVWFYAGVMGPLVGISADGREPLEKVSLDRLPVLAPDLRLDTGLAIMEVPEPMDGGLDW